MDSYNLCLKPSAEKDLRKLAKDVLQRIFRALESLASDPFPHQASRLTGTDRLYRIRIGDYRIVYEVDTEARQVSVQYVRHRREVYRQL